ncbi:uncharacterized protein HMPREF1541_01266 [Cyphellophora europaea CBS 101466]|uniref:SHSP domain-containing protein n=1 Tax=Cyphellophora europaea (strain CBS 101466) TaxID=1220924 RepID=W2SEB5_CYPE1|nr:uncharacterized protein HMPREF1541_01266 [Cyphellophora europaea CBS 101466]ETN47076.1 hypothetical protein HMPREF1541_01266 [Cyphellophora europaea CBS 101466]
MPIREVPLFSHTPPPESQTQAQAQAQQETSTNSDTQSTRQSITRDNNEWSTVQQHASAPSSIKHGWVHMPTFHVPHPHLRHPHVDLSHFWRNSKPSSTTTSTKEPTAAKDANTAPPQPYYHLPYLPSSTLWPTHLFSDHNPFHWSNLAHHPTATTNTNPTTVISPPPPFTTPPADVRALPTHYVLELSTPGLSPSSSSSSTTTTTTTSAVSLTFLSPHTLLVSGSFSRRALATDPDAQDGGTLCRTPTRESLPPPPAENPGQAKTASKAGKEGEAADDDDDGGETALLLSEREVGEWRRTFVLPEDARLGLDPSGETGGDGGLKWEVEDGVLTIWVPRVKKQ